MKKHGIRILLALALAAALTAAVYALAAPEPAETPGAAETVSFQNEALPATDSLAVLTENPNFAQAGFRVRPVSDAAVPLSEGAAVSRGAAMETATAEAQAQNVSGASSVNAVLADFTDTQTPVLPETHASMTDVRVWIVTFSDVTMERGGPSPESVCADFSVVIDAASGEVLETFAYPA